MFSNASFKINQENIASIIVSSVIPDKSPVFTPTNNDSIIKKNHQEIINVKSNSKIVINLDSSSNSKDMINIVKKAMDLNANYVNSYQMNVNNPLQKSSIIINQ